MSRSTFRSEDFFDGFLILIELLQFLPHFGAESKRSCRTIGGLYLCGYTEDSAKVSPCQCWSGKICVNCALKHTTIKKKQDVVHALITVKSTDPDISLSGSFDLSSSYVFLVVGGGSGDV